MDLTCHDPPGVFPPVGPYAHGVQAHGAGRLLFLSGTMDLDEGGVAPPTIEAQLDLLWRNIRAILAHAGMDTTNLVKVTCFLSDRAHRVANTEARRRALGEHKVATTVVVAELLESAWLVEIEAIAAA
jgi:enamine deaminase RidA (YjgF/YER057c/UK114 family)